MFQFLKKKKNWYSKLSSEEETRYALSLVAACAAVFGVSNIIRQDDVDGWYATIDCSWSSLCFVAMVLLLFALGVWIIQKIILIIKWLNPVILSNVSIV